MTPFSAEWKPKDSAPEKGLVLAWDDWRPGPFKHVIVEASSWAFKGYCTHWMPLPLDPITQGLTMWKTTPREQPE